MSQIIYDDKLYNEEVKTSYIKEHKTRTQKNLERIFKVSAKSEFDLDKDIYNFTREELRKLFYTFMASTPAGSKGNVQQVQTYIDWAVEEGYTSFNPIETVDTKWKEQFVVRPEKAFWTDKEVRQMLKEIVTAQVAVVFYAPFIGIKGHNNSEIVNLKKSDVNVETLEVMLLDEKTNGAKSKRTISVDELFISLCNQALNENEYIKSNGSPDPDLRSSEVAHLIDNDFVVRSVDIRVKNVNEADGMVVYRRFETISSYFGEEKLNPTTIMYSGMLAKAKDFLLEGNLNEESYQKIAIQFNLSPEALKRCRSDFLNEYTIKDLYGIA